MDYYLLLKCSQRQVRYLRFSTISLSPFPLLNPGYVQTGNNDFRSFILRYLCPAKTSSWKNFDDVISSDLWFRPSLGVEQKKKVFTQIWSDFLPKIR